MDRFPLGRFSVCPGLGSGRCSCGIAFVPFFALGAAFSGPNNPVLTHELVRSAARLGRTPAQIALVWTLSVAPIPGTSSVAQLEENLAVADVELDDELRGQRGAVA